LYIVGVGPGDPELMTLKAAHVIADAPVVAFFAKRGTPGHSRSIAASWIGSNAIELRLEYPFTTEVAVHDKRYIVALDAFYKCAAAKITRHLESGRDVALLCEGDPFFYGSSLAVLDRLDGTYASEVIPGVTGMSGCWTRAGMPMVHGDDVLMVLPGTMDEDRLVERLGSGDAAVIMKVGRNLPKICSALRRTGLMSRALYIEHGTMPGERIIPLEQLNGQATPYFSLVLVPGRQRAR
jgi:precorrin-2/cobalt-factor-2 C20-methyltransferase